MMLIWWSFLFLSFFLIIIICSIPTINIQNNKTREKKSPFECGFDPFSKPRTAFSIHFFSISLIFLIFDIEITMILPSPILSNKIKMYSWMPLSLFLFLILVVGIMIEWKEGSLNWN